MKNLRRPYFVLWSVTTLLFILSLAVSAQHIRGALEGTVNDPSGAVIAGAKVTLQNQATGADFSASTNSSGYFNFQNLEAGLYTISVEQSGFRKFVAKDVNVKVGSVTPLTIAMEVGRTEQVVEVTATSTEATVDTSRSTVDGVIDARTIQNLPLNGRNFLDLAQLEPGVQVRDGGDFDPTKNQFAGVSVGGRSGRSTRIQVDGVDITDETVGTTTTNVSNESIQEFQISRSSLDPSTDLTSSGAVNIVTRSGSNQIHGSGFGFFRDESYAADLRLTREPGTPKPSFDRQQMGGRAGGFFIKDKLFWHVEYENNNQDGQQLSEVPNFPKFSKAFPVPLDENLIGGRLDWNVTQSLKAFYRFNHNYNFGVTGFGGVDLSAFANKNNTNFHVTGVDFSTTRMTNSIRFSYLNFNNFIVDANTAAGTPTTLDPAGKPVLIRILGALQDVGPDLLAPQQTFQDNKQIKYDGSFNRGSHTFRFGTSYNRIDQGGFASFFGLAPRIRASYTPTSISFANANGGAADPLNFPLNQIVLGNGLGAFSEKPTLGFPNGGTINNRLGFYFSDSWKVTRRFTLNLGVRYDYDSGLSNSDLKRTPTLAQFNPALGGFVNNDNNNIAPQLGFAWDVKGNGKWVIRGGGGIFYETNVINNFLFDRVLNLAPGLGNDTPILTAGSPKLLDPATGNCLYDATNFRSAVGQCGVAGGVNLFSQPLKNVIAAAQQMQATLQQVTAALAAKYPPPGVPPLFDQVLDAENSILFNKYKRPYGLMFNIGLQREIMPGLVLSVDYLRNRGVHFTQTTDLNRIGAANTLNAAVARDIISGVNGDLGCPANASAAAINCAIAAGAAITDYADAGLGAGSALDGFAFQGSNPNFRTMGFLQPLGLSTYNALSVNLRGRLGSWKAFRGVTANVSYALSSFKATSGDQDFLALSAFNDAPTKFYGPTGLDRRHQFTFSILTDLPKGFRFNTSTRISSSLAQSAFISCVECGAAEIFFSDLDGDGITQDPLPGTNRGSFGRDVKDGKALNALISAFNSSQVANGSFTPAGRALVSAGLFTEAQLRALGGTVLQGTPVPLAPPNQVGLDRFVNTDIRLSWVYKVKERVSIQPMVEVFNLFNIGNYDSPGSPLTNLLDASVGSINGTTRGTRSNRYGLGSGSFAPGIPRAFQFAFRVEF